MALHHAHVGLTVENMGNAIWFYQELMGMKIVHRGGSDATNPASKGTHLHNTNVQVVWLQLGEFHVELVDYGNGKARKFDMNPMDLGGCHIAFFVDDVFNEYRRFKQLGFWFRSEPIDWGTGRSSNTYGRDRDQHWFELCSEHGVKVPHSGTSHAHIGRTVKDLDQALWFYRDLIGMDVVWQPEPKKPDSSSAATHLAGLTVRVAWVQLDGFRIELVDYGNAKERKFDMDPMDLGGTHMAFFCDDVWAEYERLRSSNIWFRSPPIDWGPDKPTTTYGRDPDGHWFELISKHAFRP